MDRDAFARNSFVETLGLGGYEPHEIEIMWTADAFAVARQAAYRIADLKLATTARDAKRLRTSRPRDRQRAPTAA
jgi:hypothetical protein